MPIVGSFAGASARAYGLGAGGVLVGDFESISTTTVGAGGTSSVTFSSIPATYTHLQIRIILRSTSSGSGSEGGYLNFNSDTGSNYTYHRVYGDGASASSGGAASQTNAFVFDYARSGADGSGFMVAVIDILDYDDGNKYKTVRSLTGRDANGSGRVGLYSSVWRSASAITSITLAPEANNFAQYSSFALYGVNA